MSGGRHPRLRLGQQPCSPHALPARAPQLHAGRGTHEPGGTNPQKHATPFKQGRTARSRREKARFIPATLALAVTPAPRRDRAPRRPAGSGGVPQGPAARPAGDGRPRWRAQPRAGARSPARCPHRKAEGGGGGSRRLRGLVPAAPRLRSGRRASPCGRRALRDKRHRGPAAPRRRRVPGEQAAGCFRKEKHL